MKRIGLTLLILLGFLLVAAVLTGIVLGIDMIFNKYGCGKYGILVPFLFFAVSVYLATGDFYKQKEEDEKSRNKND